MAHWLQDDRIDSWVPGSLRSYDECRRAVHTARKHMKHNGGHPGYNKWLKQFETGTNVYMTPAAPNQAGLGGGCICLADPDMAYTWHTQMAPLLKRQVDNYKHGKDPLPKGKLGGHNVMAVCENDTVGGSGKLNKCRALTERLYEREYSTKHEFTYKFPDDNMTINRDPKETTCYPEYILPRFG